MQVVKRVIMVLVVLWFSLLLFMPKEALYYQLEQRLATEGIEINEEAIAVGAFSLTLKGVAIYVKGIEVATVEQIELFSLLFYSRLTIESLRVDDTLKAMVPQETYHATVYHSLLLPLEIRLDANGSFGTLTGHVDISHHKVRIDFPEVKSLGVLRTQLKQGEEGLYYETAF